VALLVFQNGLHGDAAVTATRFPRLKFVFLDQRLNSTDRQVEQFGRVKRAAVIVRGFCCGFGGIHVVSLEKVRMTLTETIIGISDCLKKKSHKK
jgi:hypothetical protein